MTPHACHREDAVLAAALETPRAPLSDELAAHLAQCDDCRNLHTIASALHDDHAAALADARVPSAGQTWWRAELRARQEAAALAARPITVVSGLAAACLVGALASVAGVLVWWLQGALVSPAAQMLVGTTSMSAEPGYSVLRLAVWLTVAALLVAMPVLLYVALREE